MVLNQMVEHRSSPALDRTYAALAHQVRRDVLARLRDGSARVTDLAEPFDMSLAAVSKHIGVLEEAGLVRRTIVGREHRLSLDAKPLMKASGWIDTYRAFWEERLDALETLLSERRKR